MRKENLRKKGEWEKWNGKWSGNCKDKGREGGLRKKKWEWEMKIENNV